MTIIKSFNQRKCWPAAIFLLSAGMLLSACGPAVALPVVPVVENPPTPTPEPLS